MPPVIAYADPCNGQFSHTQAKGCCPIEVSLNNSKVTKGLRSSTDLGVLPLDFVDILTSVDTAYLRQDDHTTDPSFDMGSALHKDLMMAVTDGRVSCEAAVAEFVNRLPSAADAAERAEIRDYMGGLKDFRAIKGPSKSRENDVKGNMLYLWAAVTKRVHIVGGSVATVGGDTIIAEIEKLMAAESDAVRRVAPRLSIVRLDTEAKFDAALMQWSLMVHLVGVMNSTIQARFLWSVAYLTRHHADLDFWAAQEYFIACLDLLDRKICTVENVADRDRNVMISNAQRLGSLQATAVSGGSKAVVNTQTGVKKVWNGQFKPNTPANAKVKPCVVFNGKAGGVHNPGILDKNGSCVFRHVCNAWVDDKGSGGLCESDAHGRVSGPCDNAHKCATCMP
jgi:hypothetical protein